MKHFPRTYPVFMNKYTFYLDVLEIYRTYRQYPPVISALLKRIKASIFEFININYMENIYT